MQMVPVSPQNSAQLVMVYPGNPGMHHHSCHHKHKCKKRKKKKESDSESDSDSDTEYYYVRNPGQPSDSALVVDDGAKKGAVYLNPVNGGAGGRKQYDVFAPSHPHTVNQYVHSYSYDPGKDERRRDYSSAMQAAAQSEADYYTALDRYNWAVAQPRYYWYGRGYWDPYTDPYRPSDAVNEFDDYYCRPNYYDPTVFDCINEGFFHNM